MDSMIEWSCSASEPARAIEYKLDQLLDQMIVETFPEVIDTGPVIGREIW